MKHSITLYGKYFIIQNITISAKQKIRTFRKKKSVTKKKAKRVKSSHTEYFLVDVAAARTSHMGEMG